MLIDTHCHLHNTDYEDGVEVIIEQAHGAGVQQMITIGTSAADSRLAVEFAANHPSVFATIGVHPSYLSEDSAFLDEFDLTNPKIVAVGEIGLDYHYPDTDKPAQAKLLRQQIQFALAHDLPIVFHVRDAFADFWRLTDEFPIKKALLHSFSDNLANIEQALGRDWLVGVNGIATFTKNPAQIAAFKAIPLDHLVVETDAPYLSPQGKRGRINQPAYVRDVAEFLADFYQLEFEELAGQTTANAQAFFGI